MPPAKSNSNILYNKHNRRLKRKALGAALSEFAAAFLVLVVFLFIPLVNMSFVAVRFFIADGAVKEFAHRLSLCEKRSDAYESLSSDSWWREFCAKCGVEMSEPKLSLLVCSADGAEKIILGSGQQVPAAWLPGGAKAPCIYSLDLSVDLMIQPVYNGGGPPVAGLTQAIPFTLNGKSNWENLSVNPASKHYFINE